MAELRDQRRAEYVQDTFGRIARRYVFINRVMSFLQDVRWRREVVHRLQLRPRADLLDLGAGTGDLTFEALRLYPEARIVAVDFSPEMMRVGRGRDMGEQVLWVMADARHLPFDADSFDGVMSAFLMRNLGEVEVGFREQCRVLRSGGRMLALDTVPSEGGVLRPLVRFYMNRVVPLLGSILGQDREAYTYLPASTQGFFAPEILAETARGVGFGFVGHRRRMMGAVALVWGTKQGGG